MLSSGEAKFRGRWTQAVRGALLGGFLDPTFELSGFSGFSNGSFAVCSTRRCMAAMCIDVTTRRGEQWKYKACGTIRGERGSHAWILELLRQLRLLRRLGPPL